MGMEDASITPASTDPTIENESLSPIVEAHKAKIDERFAQARSLYERAQKLKEEGKGQEYAEMDTRANQTWSSIIDGGTTRKEWANFFEFPSDVRGNPDKEGKFVNKYLDAMHDSPQMIIKMAEESGGLAKFGGLKGISPRLLRDRSFIEALSKTKGAQEDPEFQVALRDDLFERYAASMV